VPERAGGVGEQRRESLHPSVDGDGVYLDTTLGEQLLQIAVGQPTAQVPADRDRDHLNRNRNPELGEERLDVNAPASLLNQPRPSPAGSRDAKPAQAGVEGSQISGSI
jgi:hypothetical protein